MPNNPIIPVIINADNIDATKLLSKAEGLLTAIERFENWVSRFGHDNKTGTYYSEILVPLFNLGAELKRIGYQRPQAGMSYDVRSSYGYERAFALNSCKESYEEIVRELNNNGVNDQGLQEFTFSGDKAFRFTPRSLALLRDAAEKLKEISKYQGRMKKVKQASSPSMVPEWNSATNTLSFKGKVIKTLKRSARNQVAILEAFQKLEWQTEIGAPDNIIGQQLSDTIRDLRKATKTHGLTFQGNGTGKGICWRAIQNIKGSKS